MIIKDVAPCFALKNNTRLVGCCDHLKCSFLFCSEKQYKLVLVCFRHVYCLLLFSVIGLYLFYIIVIFLGDGVTQLVERLTQLIERRTQDPKD